jgi:hypothetical protein
MGTGRQDTPPDLSPVESADTAPIDPPSRPGRAATPWPDTGTPFDSILDSSESDLPFESNDDAHSLSDSDSIDRVLLAGLDWRRPDPKIDRASSKGAPAAAPRAFHGERDRAPTPELPLEVLLEPTPGPPRAVFARQASEPAVVVAPRRSMPTWQLMAIAAAWAVPLALVLFYGWRGFEGRGAPPETSAVAAPRATPVVAPTPVTAAIPAVPSAEAGNRGESPASAASAPVIAPRALQPKAATPALSPKPSPHSAARKALPDSSPNPLLRPASDDPEPPRTY